MNPLGTCGLNIMATSSVCGGEAECVINAVPRRI